MELNADIIPIGPSQWRLVSQDGDCITLDSPPAAWVESLYYLCRGFSLTVDAGLEAILRQSRMMVAAPPAGSVVVVGCGLLAAEVTLGLAMAGWPVLVSAPGAASIVIDPQRCYTDGAAAIRAWVRTRLPAAHVEATCHWTALTPGSSNLVIVATDTVQPDRAITDHLARQRLTCLVVRAHHDTGVVGPLVAYPTGPCLACLDLTMADHDPWWLATLTSLIGRQARPSAAAAHWAGTQAAFEAEWFLRGAGSTLIASTIEVNTSQAGIARRRWQPHPDCNCQLTLGNIIDLPVRSQSGLDSEVLPLAA